MRIIRILHIVIISSLLALAGAQAQNAGTAKKPVVYADKIAGLDHKAGLLDLYLDHKKGKAFLALPKADEDGVIGRYIYAAYLTAGLGSNPVGLDRSAPAGSKIIRFHRIHDKVAVFVENLSFRATANNPQEKKSVENSFATSLIWTGKIAAEEAGTGKMLIDFSSFLTRDAVGVAARLKRVKQGNYKPDAKRSFVQTESAFAFPINLEFDAWVTFAGTGAGPEVRGTTPEPNSITLVAHTTLLALPDDGYEKRRYDDRAPVFGISYTDMSAPLDQDTVVEWANRFRLQKDENGKVIKPIVFYVDNGAPEPIRSALVEGANWWADAFDKAGFPGGFRAEVLPEGVHPLDARYNVINWVHRATRGWSYGASVEDPRTGEVLRGVVLLGSLRVRQDIKIFEGLAGAAKTGSGDKDDPVQLALQRIRQLSAHEVGHPLGFAHNMAASTFGDRESVMDYPAPLVTVSEDGTLDFSKTYGVGTGDWDDWSVQFLYGEYPKDISEQAAQQALIAEVDKAGMRYISDYDSRSVGTGNAHGSVWDNGHDAVDSLDNVLAVRAKALSEFGEKNLRSGESFRALQTKIVPIYLYHRYQYAAAAKWLGGMEFVYRHGGDGRSAAVDIPWESQERALDSLLKILTVDALDMRDDQLMALSPSAVSYSDPQFAREKFEGQAGPLFDHMKAVSVASDMALSALLDPRRLNRISEQSSRVEDHPGLVKVLARIVDTIYAPRKKLKGRALRIQEVMQERALAHLGDLLYAGDVHPHVRGAARESLALVRRNLSGRNGDARDVARQLLARLDDILARAKTPAVKMPKAPKIPPGSPIGMGVASSERCWHCDTSIDQ